MSNCPEVIYKNRDNPVTIQLSQTIDDVTTLLDFSAVTRMRVEFDGPTKTVPADTANDSTLIDYSVGDGKITFNFEDLNISAGRYKATLISYDATHPNGQVLLHKKHHDLRFDFV